MNGFRIDVIDLRRTLARRRIADFVQLMKPRLVPMVLVATVAGFYLASFAHLNLLRLLNTLIGVALTTGGTLALNQAYEENIDARMKRTRTRPLPSGRLLRIEAIVFGVVMTLAGVFYLTAFVNPLTAALTGASGILYLFVYTPLKQVTSLNSVIGAIPGALPPIIGWAGATGELSLDAFVLFAIIFIWQIPHALAIAVLYQEDFRNAGIRLLPLDDPDGRSTRFQIVSHCLALLPVGMMPTIIGLAGGIYFYVSIALGLLYLIAGIHMSLNYSTASARRLFYTSLTYLPLILLTMSLDRVSF